MGAALGESVKRLGVRRFLAAGRRENDEGYASWSTSINFASELLKVTQQLATRH
jgi:hypothetical protein